MGNYTKDPNGYAAAFLTKDGKVCQKKLREHLFLHAEEKYQRFSSSLLPETPIQTLIGVRLSLLRKLAFSIAKADFRTYLKTAQNDFFEEIMLQGMVIGSACMELSERFTWIEEFIPKINNWSICDSFCSGLKIAKKYPEEVWQFLQPYFEKEEAFAVRFAIVMLLDYYVDKEHEEKAFQLLTRVHHGSYYVKMAAAWAISVYFVWDPAGTEEFLRKNGLDGEVRRMALQKILDSHRVTEIQKEKIRKLKKSETGM